MPKQQKMNGMPMLDYHTTDPCQGHLTRKDHKVWFPNKSKHRSKELLGLIHFDLYGPMPKASLNGSRYFLLFTNNFSKKSWVYSLRTKGEAFTKFKAFKEKLKLKLDAKSKFLKQTTKENSCQKNLANFVKIVGFIDN